MATRFRRSKQEVPMEAVVTLEECGTHGLRIRVDNYHVAAFVSGGMLRLNSFHPTSGMGMHLKNLGMQFSKASSPEGYLTIKVAE